MLQFLFPEYRSFIIAGLLFHKWRGTGARPAAALRPARFPALFAPAPHRVSTGLRPQSALGMAESPRGGASAWTLFAGPLGPARSRATRSFRLALPADFSAGQTALKPAGKVRQIRLQQADQIPQNHKLPPPGRGVSTGHACDSIRIPLSYRHPNPVRMGRGRKSV